MMTAAYMGRRGSTTPMISDHSDERKSASNAQLREER